MKRLTFATLLTVALVIACHAGIRSTGLYNGVIFFDRWDTCYVYSGVYLMPVSEAAKEQLRAYRGKFLQVDAKKVSQPINPGDGLIQKLEVVGAKERSPLAVEDKRRLLAVAMNLSLEQDSTGTPLLVLKLTNSSDQIVTANQLALTIFSKKRTNGPLALEPSDGPSYAYVTRQHLTDSIQVGDKKVVWLDHNTSRIDIPAHQSITLRIHLGLPMGEYQALVGNGGGVHDSLVTVSNAVSLDMTQSGSALRVE